MKRYQVVVLSIVLAALLSSCSKKTDEAATEKPQNSGQETVQTEARKPVIEILDESETPAETETTAPAGQPGAAETGGAGAGVNAGAQTGGTGAGAGTQTGAKAETKAVRETQTPRVYPVEAFEDTMYATASVHVRAGYSNQSEVLASLSPGQKVRVTGKSANGWVRIIYDGQDAYVYQKYLSDTAPRERSEGPKTEPKTSVPGIPEVKPSGNQPSSPAAVPGGTGDGPLGAPGPVPVVEPAPTGNYSGGSVTSVGPGGESTTSSGPGTGSGTSAGPGSSQGSSQGNGGQSVSSPVIVAGPGQ